MRSLSLDQLRALLEVIERGSFSAAARHLNLTQPAVSLQIRELERRSGVRLIERLGQTGPRDRSGPPARGGRTAHFPRVRCCRCRNAPLSRRLDRPRARRHDADGHDLPAAAYPAQVASRASRRRPRRQQHAVPGQRRKRHPEQDRPGPGERCRSRSDSCGSTPLRAETLVAIFPAGTRDIPERESRRPTLPRQPLLLLTEQMSSAAHPLVMRWLSGSDAAAAGADAARHGRGAQERGCIAISACRSCPRRRSRPLVRYRRAAVAASAAAHARFDRAPQQASTSRRSKSCAMRCSCCELAGRSSPCPLQAREAPVVGAGLAAARFFRFRLIRPTCGHPRGELRTTALGVRPVLRQAQDEGGGVACDSI